MILANFSFLADNADYRSFAKDCIDAEESLQNSYDSCVKLVRTAVDAAIKWVYAKDKNLSAQRKKMPPAKKDNLFDLIANPSFEQMIGKGLAGKLHYCRKAGNEAIHNNKEFTVEEGVQCLSNLFDFVQWIDRRYGRNFKPRTFDTDEIPAKESTFKKVLKGVGLVAVGVIGTLAAVILSGDKDKG